MIKRYSEFINFPIYLYTAKEVEKEIEVEDDTPSTEGEEDDKKENGEKKKSSVLYLLCAWGWLAERGAGTVVCL